MKKVMISLAIILVGVLGSIYFRFFFDNRFFLKNETKEVVSLLSDINAGEEFELSSFTEADSIFVVEPYNDKFFETNSHLKLFGCIKKSIEHMTIYDGYCQLLFVKGNKVVSFADINRSVADFCGLDTCSTNYSNPKFSVKTTLYLDENKRVRLKE